MVLEHQWRKNIDKIAQPLEHQHEGMQWGAREISSQVLLKTAPQGFIEFGEK